MKTMANPRYFEDLEVGDPIPAWSRRTDPETWNRYAAVNDEFLPMHMDDEAGRTAGNERGAFGMGNLRFAYICNALRQWCGDEGAIREVGCRFRAINQKNDELTVVGTVREKYCEAGEHLVRLEIDVRNQHGQSTAPGHAIVVLPSLEAPPSREPGRA